MKALLGVLLALLAGYLAEDWGLSFLRTFILSGLCGLAGGLFFWQLTE